jgi:hypothetical protein
MLYTPVAGTPLYEKHKQDGTLLPESEMPYADAHGQYRFNYRHQHIRDGQEEQFLLEAFRRDFRVNGPSLLRMIRVLLNGWQKYKGAGHLIRDRVAWEVFPLRSSYAGAVWAMRKWYRRDRKIFDIADRLLTDIYAEFGWKTRVIAPAIGLYALSMLKREEKRLAEGWSYEPLFSCRKNPAALALPKVRPEKEKAQRAGSAIKGTIPVFNAEKA